MTLPNTRKSICIGLTLVTTLLLAACSDSSGTLSAELDSSPRGESDATTGIASLIEWDSCERKLTLTAPEIECATFDVPIDHDNPEAGMTELALARIPATGPDEERIGSLIMNPGGPGASGVDFLAVIHMTIPADLSRQFDLVSFDPRGVERSDPIQCTDPEELEDDLFDDRDLDTRAAMEAEIAEVQAEVIDCQENSSELINFMSTVEVARDLDLIRDAVGDEKLTFAGLSYGTRIGAYYATLFPNNVRALLLDGPISPQSTGIERERISAIAFERSFENFVTACDADTDCALSPNTNEQFLSIRESITTDPVTVTTASGDRELTEDLFNLAVISALYDSQTWGILAEALQGLHTGGAQTLFSIADMQTGRRSDGTYSNALDSRTVVNCSDTSDRYSIDEAETFNAELEALSPTFHEFFEYGLMSCIGWEPAPQAQISLDGAGAPPILVIGSTGDPATPIEWAQDMVAALDSASLLTYEGASHVAFGREVECIDDHVSAYFIDLQLPAPGSTCAGSDDAVQLGGLTDMLVDELVSSGIPAPFASCIVQGLKASVGDKEFGPAMMGEFTEELEREMMRISLACMTVGE